MSTKKQPIIMNFYHRYKYHFFFWSCYILYAYSIDIWTDPRNTFLDNFFVNICQIFIFYISYYSYTLINQRKWIYGFIAFAFSFVGCWILRYFYREYFLSFIGLKPFIPYEFWSFTNRVVRVFIMFSLYALGYFFAQRSIQKQKQLRLAEQQKAQAEKLQLEMENKNLRLQEDKALLQNEKIKLEYNFLKAQINPHFLYNTLNFFYSKTLMHSEEAADGIAKLTDIMRYALQQGGADGRVFLEQEVEHLHNYIALQQMRFNHTIRIKFNVTGSIHSYRILPHILITLLENAFKHGDTLNPQHPILVNLHAADSHIHFSIHNKVRLGPKDGPSTGVGLKNIADRLQMEYGNQQVLQYNNDGTFFDVELSIKLQEINSIKTEDKILITN